MAFEDVYRSLRIRSLLKANTIEATTLSSSNIVNGFAQYAATAVNTVNSGFIGLANSTTAILISVPAPGVAGKFLVIRNNSATGTAAHVVTATGSTFDGTNNTATLDAPGEQLMLYSVSATAWIVLLNTGSVGLSVVA
jgi:hypothetical protein